MNTIESIARIICIDRGYDPDILEPGDLPKIDGSCPNGDPGHFMWRQFTPLAKKIVKDLASNEPLVRKTIKITKCPECPYCQGSHDNHFYCWHTKCITQKPYQKDRVVPSDKVHELCPLP